MSSGQIPSFSLADLGRPSTQAAFREVATKLGVFYLTGYGMTEDDHRVAREAAMLVFEHSSAEEKQTLTTQNSNIRRGFSGLGAESTAIVTNSGAYSDYSMCYSMGLTENLFPSTEFEAVWTRYFSHLYRVAQSTAQSLLQATGSNNTCDLKELLDCDPVLRLRYFPEVPEERVAERVPLRMAPHYDLSIVTLIHQTPCANGFVSLQAIVGDEVVDVPAQRGSIVVLCGAVATLVSQGAIPAPKHQVAAPPANLQLGSSRTSSVFFLRPKSSFTFSVSDARKYGLNVSLSRETATFGDWIGTNYEELNVRAKLDKRG